MKQKQTKQKADNVYSCVRWLKGFSQWMWDESAIIVKLQTNTFLWCFLSVGAFESERNFPGLLLE